MGRFILDIRKGKLLYDGMTKKVYATNNPEQIILHFKDDLPVKPKKGNQFIKNKGIYNTAITVSIFKFLQGYHVKTHFVDILKPNEILVKNCEIIPIEVKLWNLATENLCRRFGITKGTILTYPIIELYLKNKNLRYPMMNMDHACAFGYTSPQEIIFIDRMARKINAVLKSFFSRRGMQLIEFNLEFGRLHEKIMVVDEISMDTFSLSETEDDGKLGKDLIVPGQQISETDYSNLKTRIIP
jgi:phosphoribosylaminoimidazole-succinocarboxamide synthase